MRVLPPDAAGQCEGGGASRISLCVGLLLAHSRFREDLCPRTFAPSRSPPLAHLLHHTFAFKRERPVFGCPLPAAPITLQFDSSVRLFGSTPRLLNSSPSRLLFLETPASSPLLLFLSACRNSAQCPPLPRRFSPRPLPLRLSAFLSQLLSSRFLARHPALAR